MPTARPAPSIALQRRHRGAALVAVLVALALAVLAAGVVLGIVTAD